MNKTLTMLDKVPIEDSVNEWNERCARYIVHKNMKKGAI